MYRFERAPSGWVQTDDLAGPVTGAFDVLGVAVGQPGSRALAGALGALDALAGGSADVSLPAERPPRLVGLTLAHAFVAIQTSPVPVVPFASNAVPLSLVP